MERRGVKVSRNKPEFKRLNERDTGGKVNMQRVEIVKVYEFKYLGSSIQKKRHYIRGLGHDFVFLTLILHCDCYVGVK